MFFCFTFFFVSSAEVFTEPSCERRVGVTLSHTFHTLREAQFRNVSSGFHCCAASCPAVSSFLVNYAGNGGFGLFCVHCGV